VLLDTPRAVNLYSLHVFTVAHGLRLCFGHLVLVRAPSSPQCDPLSSLFDKEERYTGHTDVEIVNGRDGNRLECHLHKWDVYGSELKEQCESDRAQQIAV